MRGLLLWRVSLLIFLVAFTIALATTTTLTVGKFLLAMLAIVLGMLTFRSFLLNKPMSMGSFTLNHEQNDLRIFFAIVSLAFVILGLMLIAGSIE